MGGTFFNSSTSLCDACHPTCFTCSSGLPTSCLSCNDLQFRLLSGSTCTCNSSNYLESVNTYPKCQIVNSSVCRDVEVWDKSL